jgi:serine/threonine protein kinase
MLQERIDQVVKGYELREQIGEGGYGVVYRAYQPLIGRDVAVKIILPQYANQPDFIRRFEWEAQLVARLEHPYIVPLYDYWRDSDGAFLVMRWLRGGNLHDLLHNKPLPTELLGRLIEQVGSALAVAHRRGVVHRDLKPANILLDEEGNAYLADFGIAKDMGTRVSPYQTDTSTVVGSPAYISPEQVRAEPITPQTDIYSLGVMLYEILTGQLPFHAPTPIALMFMHMNEPVPTVRAQRPDLSDAVNQVIQKATAKRPSDRYTDVTTLIRDLRQALASGPDVTARLIDPQPAPTQPEQADRTTSGRTPGSKYETGLLYLPVPLATPVEIEIENPYKGLRAFQEADAGDFFGREMLTQLLLARMQEQVPLGRFLAVVGPSGSGKSSVVRAGVVPAIRRGELPGSQNWFVVEMFPSANPIQELAQALIRIAVEPPNNLIEPLMLDDQGLLRVIDQVVPGADETEVVLVIDQFEEVFTLVEDEAVRAHFLNSLINAVTDPYTRIRVIVTLRADFYDRPLLYPGFSELMRQRTEVVVPLAPEELKQAIVSPAERNGLRVDSELVEAIINDVAEQPGALPLLQYALTEVFERRSGRTLTLTPYHESGGVLGALARRAEDIYISLSPEQQEATRQLFLRLVTLGEGVEDTRRRVRRTEL